MEHSQQGRSVLADALVERGYKAVQPLASSKGHAVIFRVQDSEEDDAEPYVAKVISLITLDDRGRAKAQQEVSLLKALSTHPNLIAYRESFLEEPGNLYIMMSLADGGDLQCVVKECRVQKVDIPEPIVLTWLKQTLSGLEHLHGLGVVHRDLKSSNIFLCQGRQRIRIGDFGISRVLESTAFATSCVGTPAYMSPELMRNERYDFHVDMWALGCICFELSTLKMPFTATSLVELAEAIMGAEPMWSFWTSCSEELCDVARRLLMKDAAARPSAGQLLLEPLFEDGGRASYAVPESLWRIVRPQHSKGSMEASHDLGDGSTTAESSAHLSRAEFAELLNTHHSQLLSDLQQGAARSNIAAAVDDRPPSDARPVRESLV